MQTFGINIDTDNRMGVVAESFFDLLIHVSISAQPLQQLRAMPVRAFSLGVGATIGINNRKSMFVDLRW